MSEIKNCPFCNEGVIYETSREDYLGTVIPQLFCNSCKMIFEVENDSPYLDDKKTEEYLREKLHRQFNTRKPMQEIVERLEDLKQHNLNEAKKCSEFENFQVYMNDNRGFYRDNAKCYEVAIGVVKEVGGMNE